MHELWYSGGLRSRNGVCILVDGKFRKHVVEIFDG